MKRKNTFIIIALLLAVVALGVGYAASTGTWIVNGTATAEAGDFDVAFTAVNEEAEDYASVESDTVAKMDVSLKEVTDSQSATFTITNKSAKGIGASIPEVVVTYDDGTEVESKYFNVTTELSSNTIASDGGEVTLTVTVELKQSTPVEVTESFKVSLGTITAVQE